MTLDEEMTRDVYGELQRVCKKTWDELTGTAKWDIVASPGIPVFNRKRYASIEFLSDELVCYDYLIRYFRYWYYVEKQPKITDTEFDALLHDARDKMYNYLREEYSDKDKAIPTVPNGDKRDTNHAALMSGSDNLYDYLQVYIPDGNIYSNKSAIRHRDEISWYMNRFRVVNQSVQRMRYSVSPKVKSKIGLPALETFTTDGIIGEPRESKPLQDVVEMTLVVE